VGVLLRVGLRVGVLVRVGLGVYVRLGVTVLVGETEGDLVGDKVEGGTMVTIPLTVTDGRVFPSVLPTR